ncbi:Intracellular serine protease [Bacillus pumilus]|nr:Intracellular serine protease [Bacillus pumilus]
MNSFGNLSNEKRDFIDEEVLPWSLKAINKNVENESAKKKIKIAVLDSGINNKHKDLKGKVSKSYNTIDTESPIKDDFNHGTPVAGIITGNNNYKHIGVTQNAELIDVKVLNKHGKGKSEDLLEGLKWSIEQKVDIINISFGIESNLPEIEKAIKEAIESNIVVVAAAGNTLGLSVTYPAKYDGVISVTSVDENLKRSSMSAKGKIDFSAPGEKIISTDANGDYSTFYGTSFATAYVTGLIADYMSDDKPKNVNDIYLEFKKSAVNLGERNKYGYGLIQDSRRDVN